MQSIRSRTVVAAVATTALLAACGGDDVAAGPQDITVIATDYAFSGLPSTIAAGSTFTIDNQAADELHEVVAIKLPADETRSISEILALPPEEMAVFFPGVRMVILQPPGSDEVIVAEGDGMLSEPGRYLFGCFIPTGADPGEYLRLAAESEGGPPEVPGGPPHFVQGMFQEVTVTG